MRPRLREEDRQPSFSQRDSGPPSVQVGRSVWLSFFATHHWHPPTEVSGHVSSPDHDHSMFEMFPTPLDLDLAFMGRPFPLVTHRSIREIRRFQHGEQKIVRSMPTSSPTTPTMAGPSYLDGFHGTIMREEIACMIASEFWMLET